MPQVVIENPVLNSPYEEPSRHFYFDEDGITDKVVASRRLSSYFIPIAKPKKKGKQLELDTEWTKDRIEENKFINDVRHIVSKWRLSNYDGVTGNDAATAGVLAAAGAGQAAVLLPDRGDGNRHLSGRGRGPAGRRLDSARPEAANEDTNPLLARIAFKMATGSGKTVVMAMLIAWHALNKLASPQDSRFADAFLIVTPGITIRDRLRVLLPNDPENDYRQDGHRAGNSREQLGRAKILITNYHTFLLREKVAVGKLTKQVLGNGGVSAFTETPDEIVRRVCRGLGNKKNIVVINDEAHHCYRGKPEGSRETQGRRAQGS